LLPEQRELGIFGESCTSVGRPVVDLEEKTRKLCGAKVVVWEHSHSCMSGTLDSFLTSSRPAPQVVCTSQEIRDRGSIFIANAFRVTTPVAARTALNHLKHVLHGQRPATHEIVAWRCMVLKSGRTGLDGPDDFKVQTGTDDDGEQWAASKVAKVMEDEGVIDAVVIVSRW
jgi:Uncharacterized protein family UPF0029